MIRITLYYSLKVWLTSVVLSPMLCLLIDSFTKHSQTNLEGGIGFILFSILYGLILSALSWLLLWGFSYLLLQFSITTVTRKVILSFISSFLTIIPFLLLFSRDDGFPDAFTIIWTLSYAVVIVIGVWYYKIESIAENTIFQKVN
jgi:hypothetical protein